MAESTNGQRNGHLSTFQRFFSSKHFRENTGWCSLQQWMKEFSSNLASAPISKGSDICLASSLIGPSTILIGDAGHSAGARGGMGSVSLGLSFLLQRVSAGQIWQSWIRSFSVKH